MVFGFAKPHNGPGFGQGHQDLRRIRLLDHSQHIGGSTADGRQAFTDAGELT